MGIMINGENALLMVSMLAALLAIAGAGVISFIRVGVVWAGFERLLQEGEYTPRRKAVQGVRGRDCAGILDDGGSGISERELPDGKMGAELADMGGGGRAVPGGQRRLRRAASGARRALTGRTTMNARRCRRRAFKR